MAVGISEIRDELRKADSDAAVVLFLDRKVIPIQELVRVPGTPFVLLCDKSRGMMRNSFTESERGMIGYCAARGISDAKIGQMLGRAEESIIRVRKKFGIAASPDQPSP